MSVVRSLLNRAKKIPSEEQEKRKEVKLVKEVLSNNGYPKRVSLNDPPRRQHTSERPKGFVVLPYIQGITPRLTRVLTRANIRVAQKPMYKIGQLIPRPKTKLSKWQTKGIIYEIPCRNCEKTYIGHSGNSLGSRISQHKASIRLLQPEKSALAEHSIQLNHSMNFDATKILAVESNYSKRILLESYFISKNSSAINKNCDWSIPSIYSSSLTQ